MFETPKVQGECREAVEEPEERAMVMNSAKSARWSRRARRARTAGQAGPLGSDPFGYDLLGCDLSDPRPINPRLALSSSDRRA
jgi:hypothetical protein